MKRRTSDHLPGLPARFPFVCLVCGNDGVAGERVFYRRGQACHVRCQSGADDE